MKFHVETLATIACLSLVSEAYVVNFCKQPNKVDCIPVTAGDGACTNLHTSDGRPFVSGYSDGHVCNIYFKNDCSGTANAVDGSGWAKFSQPVWSFECNDY
ncbi:hypothetical protein MGYG_08127 [Paecilomyces variotii No. 5]|uniref:Uncharacterized protein n=1 Tax=Byssochlamys spectabilis (strain No. 5 / NBRC 109023) TaxID=1356009 RepID=V5GC09_BYSSN|nr:hypothetical protein MGYG_08127 [Paecilomyces variotii No. 5]